MNIPPNHACALETHTAMHGSISMQEERETRELYPFPLQFLPHACEKVNNAIATQRNARGAPSWIEKLSKDF